jgi:hypothetical protein
MPFNGGMPAITAMPVPAALARSARAAAVLVGGCDGYPAGTTGEALGAREGCVVFAPHRPAEVARWAAPRSTLLVPHALVVVAP